MARRIAETFFGYQMPDVWVEVEGVEYHGELRAWAFDDDTDSIKGKGGGACVPGTAALARRVSSGSPPAAFGGSPA